MTDLYWLASYPKSGNTWVRLLLQSYTAGGTAVNINALTVGGGRGDERAQFDEFIGVPAADLTNAEILAWYPFAFGQWARQLNETLYFKTHNICSATSITGAASLADLVRGAVYLVRDPRDVALSFARHIGRGVDEAIKIMGTPGKQMGRSQQTLRPRLLEVFGSWSENVEGWLDHAPFPVHLLPYESLRADPRTALTGLVAALGLPVDPLAVEAAVAATDLAELRRQEAAVGFAEWRGVGGFFGQGRVRGWRDRLTPAQVAQIEADHGPMMRRLGYLPADH
ncbi:sulfotransferase domain-containing protein [Elstera cyanobacteriorum]|uniref:sulfotransferase domain-containing protein n=1 Tax=Elstera cyanobacteriorum TaxID=2022747 RepID=UPI0023568517|nr:sulfotransferase domain-containing protein [Elstera cyanobacteriorum]MCK6444619.1 sulfotransferase domain-containing protein [Elstera cyanobacteriorum]